MLHDHPEKGKFGSECLLLALGSWGKKQASAVYALQGWGCGGHGWRLPLPRPASFSIPHPHSPPVRDAGSRTAAFRGGGGQLGRPGVPAALKDLSVLCIVVLGAGVEGQPGGTCSVKAQQTVPASTL